jgi:hypothetical protein
MSTALLDRPAARAGTARAVASSGSVAGPTLEGVVVRAWEGLAAHRGVGCPMCGGQMTPRYGASGMEPVGGRCGDCGTTLG